MAFIQTRWFLLLRVTKCDDNNVFVIQLASIVPPFVDEALLFQAPHAERDETRANARYRWGCRNRGTEPFVILQWTHEGSGVFRHGGTEYPVPAATAFISVLPEEAEYGFPAGAPGPWRFSWINFYGALACGMWRRLRDSAGPVIPLAPRSRAGLHLTRLIRGVKERRFADRYEVSAEAFAFFMTLCRQLRAPSVGNLLAERMTTVLCPGNAWRPVGVKALAAEAGVSREHFSRVFKSRRGETPGAFLRLQRFQAAEDLLRSTSLPLREIALRCGFTSARHLADAFRIRHGCSPRQARGRWSVLGQDLDAV